MSEKQTVAVNADAATAAFAQITLTLADMKPVFREFHAYHAARIDADSRARNRGAPVRTLSAPDLRESALPHNRAALKSRWYGPRLSTSRGSARRLGEMAVGRSRPAGSRLGHSAPPEAGLRPSVTSGLLEVTNRTLTYGPAEDPSKKRPWYTFTQGDADHLLDITEKVLTGGVKTASLGSFGGKEAGA